MGAAATAEAPAGGCAECCCAACCLSCACLNRLVSALLVAPPPDVDAVACTCMCRLSSESQGMRMLPGEWGKCMIMQALTTIVGWCLHPFHCSWARPSLLCPYPPQLLGSQAWEEGWLAPPPACPRMHHRPWALQTQRPPPAMVQKASPVCISKCHGDASWAHIPNAEYASASCFENAPLPTTSLPMSTVE